MSSFIEMRRTGDALHAMVMAGSIEAGGGEVISILVDPHDDGLPFVIYYRYDPEKIDKDEFHRRFTAYMNENIGEWEEMKRHEEELYLLSKQ